MSRRYSPIAVFLSICVFCCYCLSAPAWAQNLGDFNGDGKADILWRNVSTGDAYLWTMDGAAIDLPASGVVYAGVAPQWQIAGIGDFYGSGKSDILWRDAGTGDLYLWSNVGVGTFSSVYVTTQSDLDWQVVGVGDFNDDGKSDILWRNNATGEVYLWEMNGASISISGSVYTISDLSWQIAGVGDFYGSGKSDILWYNVGTGEIYLWSNIGVGAFSSSYINTQSDLDWQIVGIGDFNGDGMADILWRNISTGDVYLWTMDGATTDPAASGYVAQGVSLQWQVDGVGDFYGTGKSDILWYNVGTGALYLWSGVGVGAFDSSYINTQSDLDWQPVHSARKVYGLGFGPYIYSGQDPITGTDVSSDQIASLLAIIAPYTNWVRTFGTLGGLEYVGSAAHSLGLKTMIGIYIDGTPADDDPQITSAIQIANAGGADVIAVGNEFLYDNPNYSGAEQYLLNIITEVRQQIPSSVKITCVDTWGEMVAHPDIIQAVDIVSVNIYPFYEENVSIDQALGQLQSDYQMTVQAASVYSKPVWITETGWPSAGNAPSQNPVAIPSVANASTYFKQAEQWARSQGIPLFYFEAFDEAWKATNKDYPTWGIWNVNSNLKTGMNIPFQ